MKNTIEQIIGNEILKIEKENNKYVENPNQMSKFNYAKGFFCKYIRENKGKLVTEINSNQINAGLTITMPIINLIDVDLRRFTNILKFSTAVTFDTTNSGQVCVSLTIPNIYVRRVN